ncbi:MAG TPA: DUF4167 domain-containing protein [Rhodobacteraceae bacterium]|nr:DUF4167 domain-containing protein [Paracoccaceae bacterium]
MRSSKSRSRSKNNRNRSVGNIMNRVFDSSGPEGKVRGTPQQIIEKYNQLARDAQLSNDIVAAENFQQHAEHYTRLLSEAQREIEARREAQEREHRERQQARAEQQQSRRGEHQQQPQRGGDAQPATGEAPVTDPSMADQPDVLAPVDDGESILVETPEEAPAKPRRARKPRRPAQAKAGEGNSDQPEAPEAAE